MPDTTFSHSHVDAPEPNSVLAPGRHVLRGWVWPRTGGHFVDVRARIGQRIFPGVHGRPRADIAAHFKTGRPVALAEFNVTVELVPGRVDVVLEVLKLEGDWTEFQTVAYRVEGPGRATLAAPAPHQLRWHDFTRGLELILRTRRDRPGAAWQELADELAADLPQQHDLQQPPHPFIGHADEPSVVNANRFGLLLVVGYLFHTTDKIERLWATADLQTMEPLKLGRVTANLIPHFPQYPVAGVSGYEGYVYVPAQLPNPVAVRIYAQTSDGALQLVQVRTTRCHDSAIEKYPWAGATPAEFAQALAAWRWALKSRGLPLVEDDEFQSAVERLRINYLRPAPYPVTPRRSPVLPLLSDPSVRPPARIILATHNLNLEGAPLFLLDLARHLAANGARLTVVSPADGVLRSAFAECGASIVLVDVAPIFRAATDAAVREALVTLARDFLFGAADLVITNTFTAFWAVHAARAAGQRVLTYVHESTTPAAFYREHVAPAVVSAVEQALVLADAVSFTSEATRSHHAGPAQPVNAVLNHGWVDVRRIDTWLAAHPREALRARLGVRSGEQLVTNVGTVCDRKGQLSFVRAVALFNRRNPDLAAQTRFILLGGRDSPFDDLLNAVLADLALPNLTVHRETPDFLGYYAAADLTVCSSYEESSPRVVLEAMACGTPLLASSIPGICELVRSEIEASLVPPGHTTAWAEALARLLITPAISRKLATQARARIESEYAAEIVLPRHTAVARAVARGEFSS
ncbi:MAG: glycosyltransferase family 4 protein [Candidatus Didemnitutus sp.]|nr:glycosyltransferase family 4 protein [Candidatus Didemnitutus sp.]